MIGVKKNKKGFTLLEVVVSVGLFSVLILILTGFLEGVSKAQRSAIAAQDTEESLRYAFEVISKELRSAQRSDDECVIGSPNRVFNTAEASSIGISATPADMDVLYFRNKYDECVYYYVHNGQLIVERGDSYAATPDDITVTGLEFDIADNDIDVLPQDRIQPHVTLNLEAESNYGRESEKQSLYVQTTISSRFYE